MPNWPGQVSCLVLYLFFSSRPSWHWHWHWLHGALLVSRVIYVPADTRWRWLKPFLAFCNSPTSLPPCLPPYLLLLPARLSLCCLCLFSYPFLSMGCVVCAGATQTNRFSTQCDVRCYQLHSPPAPSGAPLAAHSLSGKCTVSVKGLSLISEQRQNSSGLRIILNGNLSLFITN